jgi:hypothetical protein
MPLENIPALQGVPALLLALAAGFPYLARPFARKFFTTIS